MPTMKNSLFWVFIFTIIFICIVFSWAVNKDRSNIAERKRKAEEEKKKADLLSQLARSQRIEDAEVQMCWEILMQHTNCLIDDKVSEILSGKNIQLAEELFIDLGNEDEERSSRRCGVFFLDEKRYCDSDKMGMELEKLRDSYHTALKQVNA
jgi:hypothetical protein